MSGQSNNKSYLSIINALTLPFNFYFCYIIDTTISFFLVLLLAAVKMQNLFYFISSIKSFALGFTALNIGFVNLFKIVWALKNINLKQLISIYRHTNNNLA